MHCRCLLHGNTADSAALHECTVCGHRASEPHIRMPEQGVAALSPDQAEQEHVPGVPSGHKGWEGMLHVDQDVHVADMVGDDHGCRITGRTQTPCAAVEAADSNLSQPDFVPSDGNLSTRDSHATTVCSHHAADRVLQTWLGTCAWQVRLAAPGSTPLGRSPGLSMIHFTSTKPLQNRQNLHNRLPTTAMTCACRLRPGSSEAALHVAREESKPLNLRHRQT